MIRIEKSLASFKSFFEGLQHEWCEWVGRRIESQLEAQVQAVLQRGWHERRKRVGQRQTGAQCCRCGSRQAQHFSRNGHRTRQIVTTFGVVHFGLPRVVCACGGSVRIGFSIVRPYQRLWEDVLQQVGRWAKFGLSLRQMQAEIGEHSRTQVGLRVLNRVVQQVLQPVEITLSSVPPIIMLDAIWVSLLENTPTVYQDACGRQRIKQARAKVCVLVALGLYPQTGRWGVLGWTLAHAESQAEWEHLLLPLEQRGVYHERGVLLFIHDGGKGAIAALDLLYPHIPHQRCIFHKLRNLAQAIHTPQALPRSQLLAFKRSLIRQAAAIFSAPSLEQATAQRDAFCACWQATQPELVATLCRDWHESVAFFRVLARFPNWPRTALRTTSLLERVNRSIRRLFRPAGAFHSSPGLLAAVARVLSPVRLI